MKTKSLLTFAGVLFALAFLPLFAFAADPVPGENNSNNHVESVSFYKRSPGLLEVQVSYGYQPIWIVNPKTTKATFDGMAVTDFFDLLTKLSRSDYILCEFTGDSKSNWVADTAKFTSAKRPSAKSPALGAAPIPPCNCGCMETGSCKCKNCCERTADPTWKPPAPAGMTAVLAIPPNATTVQGCANGKCDSPQIDTRWKPFGGAFRLIK